MIDDTTSLRQRWLKLCDHASLEGEQQWRIIEHGHDSPDRAYHNLNHVRDCLEQFELSPETAMDPVSLEFAIWFHDLIYDTRASDNEQRSAQAAADFLKDTGFADTVADIILSTRHSDIPEHADAQLMCDIDLSILGRDAASYSLYATHIRNEYSWVSHEDYRDGRRKVIENFLQRKQIYSLTSFHERYEAQARHNLHQEMDRLTSN